jgi:hypothetical protein
MGVDDSTYQRLWWFLHEAHPFNTGIDRIYGVHWRKAFDVIVFDYDWVDKLYLDFDTIGGE